MKLIYLFTTLILLSISVSPALAATQSGAKTSVTAVIPSKVDIRIYGYTAPYSIVQATSVRVFAQVSSDKTGYFIIDPLSISSEAKEICLTTIDAQQRYGFPLCISLPDTNKPTEIGPLLLSPTISLSTGKLLQLQNSQAVAGGQTIPNTNLEISFFENTPSNIAAKIVNFIAPEIWAKDIPKLSTKTDKNGAFSINLPTSKALTYRLFAKAFYDPVGNGAGNVLTPKSQTLFFSVSSYTNWWMINVLPKIIFLLLLILFIISLIWYDIKTKRVRILFTQFNETKWQPFGVRSRLKLRRIWYNCRAYLRSHRK